MIPRYLFGNLSSIPTFELEACVLNVVILKAGESIIVLTR